MKWININDHLPDKNTPVIAYIGDRGTAILTHYYDDFALARVSIKDGFSEHGVTHWCELVPPKIKRVI